MRDIVYACDNNYIEQTTISMVSLLKNNPYPVRFWIVSNHISLENRQLMLEKTNGYSREIIFLDIEKVLNHIFIPDSGRHPKTIYAKLFLETIIDSDRVLYLDSDTVVCESLEGLWTRNMEQELVAGVQMPYSIKLKAKMGIKPENPYLCDGIVLLNLQRWRELRVGERCRAYICEYRGIPPMLSEGTLNYVCQGYTGILPPAYNLMPSMILYNGMQIKRLFKTETYYSEEELDEARKTPRIIHFINELYNRPWLEPCDHPYKEVYRQERDVLFADGKYLFQKLDRNTQMTRILRAALPFSAFAGLYHFKHKEI